MSRARLAAVCVVAAVLGALCAVAVGCGTGGSSPKLIPRTDAAALKRTLTLVRDAVGQRECGTAATRVARLKALVAGLPSTVDSGLKADLRDGVDPTLADQAQEECSATVSEEIPTVTLPGPTGPTGPAETDPDTTPSGPTGPPATTEQTSSTTETTPPPADTGAGTDTETVPGGDPGAGPGTGGDTGTDDPGGAAGGTG